MATGGAWLRVKGILIAISKQNRVLDTWRVNPGAYGAGSKAGGPDQIRHWPDPMGKLVKRSSLRQRAVRTRLSLGTGHPLRGVSE